MSGLSQSFTENDLVCNEQIHSELVEALTDHRLGVAWENYAH